MDQSIVSRDEIQRQAQEAADKQLSLHEANKFDPGSAQSLCFEHAYWARERELNGEAYA